MNQAVDDLPDNLPFGVVETCRELLKDWEADTREAKCLRRLVADPEMCAIYWQLNEHFDDDADRIALFVREIFLAGIRAEHYYAVKPARREFDRSRHRAINAARELAEQIAHLYKLDHGGLSLMIPADTLEAAYISATRIADALSDPRKVSDFWCEQSSGTEGRPVFVRALEKILHGVDTYGLYGLSDGGVTRLLSYADMATVTRAAFGTSHDRLADKYFGSQHVIEALKSYRENP